MGLHKYLFCKGGAVQRPILQSVNIFAQGDNRQQVMVILQCEGREYSGRSESSPSEEDNLTAIALATLDALLQYLPMPVKFELKRAAKMQPDTLTNYLLVVMVELTYKKERFSLTGTCLSDDANLTYNIAKATLDATNRLVEYLLTREDEPTEETPIEE
ncbi:MAG: hypothetical protein AB1489_27685 [Acidobacteriota bacterium]